HHVAAVESLVEHVDQFDDGFGVDVRVDRAVVLRGSEQRRERLDDRTVEAPQRGAHVGVGGHAAPEPREGGEIGLGQQLGDEADERVTLVVVVEREGPHVLAHDLLGERLEQLGLAGEVAVERARRHPRLVEDGAGGRALVTVAEHDTAGGVQQPLADLLLVRGADLRQPDPQLAGVPEKRAIVRFCTVRPRRGATGRRSHGHAATRCSSSVWPSRTSAEGPPSQSSAAAYRARVSVAAGRSPSARWARSTAPWMPACTPRPTAKCTPPWPWSVPPLPFSAARRPNSLVVTRSTRSACPRCASVEVNDTMPLARSSSNRSCVAAWLAWVSNPVPLTSTTRVPRSRSMIDA